MEDMTRDFAGFVTVVLAMLLVAGLVILAVGFWLGMRRIGRGDVARALWTTNALVLVNAWLVGMAYLQDSSTEGNPAHWMIIGIGGPALLGYALGTSLGMIRSLLRGRRASGD